MRRLIYSLFICVGLCVTSTPSASSLQDMGDETLYPVAPETHGAVALGGGLPSVPELVDAHGLDPETVAELETWRESWSLVTAEGALVRSTQVYPAVVARLFPLLHRPGVADLLDENDEALRSAKRLGVLLANEEVETAVEQALRFHQKARNALESGDGKGALRLALQSADALRAVAPRQVASDLVAVAQEHLRRKGFPETYPEEELNRIRRLANGAEEALAEGDYPRAIRRAYYACQLLGAEPG